MLFTGKSLFNRNHFRFAVCAGTSMHTKEINFRRTTLALHGCSLRLQFMKKSAYMTSCNYLCFKVTVCKKTNYA